jgi:hypothetical protein
MGIQTVALAGRLTIFGQFLKVVMIVYRISNHCNGRIIVSSRMTTHNGIVSFELSFSERGECPALFVFDGAKGRILKNAVSSLRLF